MAENSGQNIPSALKTITLLLKCHSGRVIHGSLFIVSLSWVSAVLVEWMNEKNAERLLENLKLVSEATP